MKSTQRKLMVVAVMALSFAGYTLAGTSGGGNFVCCTDNTDCTNDGGTCATTFINCHDVVNHIGGGNGFCGTAGGGGDEELDQ